MTIPESALRLFPHHDPADLAGAPDFVLGRLLEDGDSADLAWLLARRGREDVRAWVERHSERQLSRRSRAFWRHALGLAPAATPAPAHAPASADETIWLL